MADFTKDVAKAVGIGFKKGNDIHVYTFLQRNDTPDSKPMST